VVGHLRPNDARHDRLLGKGQSFSFGDFVVADEAVTRVQHRLLEVKRQVLVGWRELDAWSADGKFVIGKRDDKKTYGLASYIHTWNTHRVEHLIRGALKKKAVRLSSYLKN
jgi:hypothetical protein